MLNSLTRHRIAFNLGWAFTRLDESLAACFPSDLKEIEIQPVNLPHVWNQADATQTGCCLYRKSFDWQPVPGRCHYIEFDAVAGVCRAFLNGILLGEHRGGYARFRFQLDDALLNGQNTLDVYADNTRFDDINPLTGDFNNYGGIYRDVHLIVTESTHFDLLFYGTHGISLEAQADGTLNLQARVIGADQGTQIRFIILDHGQVVVATDPAVIHSDIFSTNITVINPHVWDGLHDPYLYCCRGELYSDGHLIDVVEMHFGFRAIRFDPKQGFYLNHRPYRLNGVARHQDWDGRGCAPTRAELDVDLALITELGANAVRLSHYQHPEYFYDQCDRCGLLVWAEIPMLALPDGNTGILDNAAQQLTELILQNKHHPSIFCWGIQNEIAILGESLAQYAGTERLHQLARRLDPTRPSAAANLNCVQNNSPLNFVTDIIGYNLYYGWYYGEMADYADFLGRFHRDNPTVPLCISEYGVDCSVTLHSADPRRKDYSEEFQSIFHETVYPILEADTALWGTFIWNLADFGSVIRDEGGVKGKNCKGLVTWDRRIRKDSFYFYKACWSTEPFVYIASRRFKNRTGSTTSIKVYSNQPTVTLWINGVQLAARTGHRVFIFDQVPLTGADTIVRATSGQYEDEITLNAVDEPDITYRFIDPNPEFNVKNWFKEPGDAENMFPAGRFSLLDPIGDILDSPAAYALLEKELPQIAGDDRARQYRTMPLIRIINRNSNQFDEEAIKKLNMELGKISKN